MSKERFDIQYTPGKVKQSLPGETAPEEGPRKVVHQKDGRGRLKGVFSTQSIERVGTGTTVRKIIQKTFWMIEETESEEVEIQPLNANYIPSGPKRKVAREDILTKFQAEPEFYLQTVYPKMRELEDTVVKGEAHRAKGEMFSAEYEFHNALEVDLENIQANFGLGLIFLERGEQEKANNIFERLVKLDAAFEEEHKHLFNDFGINLRKNKMYSQALEYYERAKNLTRPDEHLHYNIARAWFENQNLEKAVEHLNTALAMNPSLEPALKFIAWLEEQGLIDKATTRDRAAQDKTGGSAPAQANPGMSLEAEPDEPSFLEPGADTGEKAGE